MKKVALIIPCYNEEDSLPYMYSEISKVANGLKNYECKFIFVNDGSKDGTLFILKDLAIKDKRVQYISFSRNFGKEAAMYAGMCNANADYVAVMDADLQDPPELLPQMLSVLEDGKYDSVATRREDRTGEPPIRSFFAKKFYQVINKISDADIVDGARDFRLMNKKMVDAVIQMGEYNRFSKGIFGWIGFETYWMSYENRERIAGRTKWNFWKLFKYAIDGIIDFSQAPLSIASWGGIGITGIAFIMIIFVIVRKLLFSDPVSGWASLVCIIMFIGGVQLFCMGIIGQYLAKVYMETKHRPIYIVGDTNIENIYSGR